MFRDKIDAFEQTEEKALLRENKKRRTIKLTEKHLGKS